MMYDPNEYDPDEIDHTLATRAECLRALAARGSISFAAHRMSIPGRENVVVFYNGKVARIRWIRWIDGQEMVPSEDSFVISREEIARGREMLQWEQEALDLIVQLREQGENQ